MCSPGVYKVRMFDGLIEISDERPSQVPGDGEDENLLQYSNWSEHSEL